MRTRFGKATRSTRSMMAMLVTAALASAAWTRTARAEEETFGDVGQVTISGERLFGYVHSKQTQSVGGQSLSASSDTFNVLMNPAGMATGYAWPRVALDAFVTHGLSVGGAVGLSYFSLDEQDLTLFMLAPRVGYAFSPAPAVAIWPRLGFTYIHSSNDANVGDNTTTAAYAITFEVVVAIRLASRAALLITPLVDAGLGGSATFLGTSLDRTLTDFGIQAGLALTFGG